MYPRLECTMLQPDLTVLQPYLCKYPEHLRLDSWHNSEALATLAAIKRSPAHIHGRLPTADTKTMLISRVIWCPGELLQQVAIGVGWPQWLPFP